MIDLFRPGCNADLHCHSTVSDGTLSPEVLAARAKDFRKLDKDGNNLLTFEEWAHATVDKFRFADGNADLWLSREEFATTRPKQKPKPKCSCK